MSYSRYPQYGEYSFQPNAQQANNQQTQMYINGLTGIELQNIMTTAQANQNQNTNAWVATEAYYDANSLLFRPEQEERSEQIGPDSIDVSTEQSNEIKIAEDNANNNNNSNVNHNKKYLSNISPAFIHPLSVFEELSPELVNNDNNDFKRVFLNQPQLCPEAQASFKLGLYVEDLKKKKRVTQKGARQIESVDVQAGLPNNPYNLVIFEAEYSYVKKQSKKVLGQLLDLLNSQQKLYENAKSKSHFPFWNKSITPLQKINALIEAICKIQKVDAAELTKLNLAIAELKQVKELDPNLTAIYKTINAEYGIIINRLSPLFNELPRYIQKLESRMKNIGLEIDSSGKTKEAISRELNERVAQVEEITIRSEKLLEKVRSQYAEFTMPPGNRLKQ